MVTAAKTASQIAVHTGVAFGIMFAFTGSVVFGGLAAIIEPICVVAILPLHERVWQRIELAIASRTLRASLPGPSSPPAGM